MNPARKRQNTIILGKKNGVIETDWKFSAMMKVSPTRDVRGITRIPEHFPVFG